MGTKVRGGDLQVGQTVKVWFTGDRGSRLLALRPYTGPLADLFPKGAQIGRFTSETPKGETEMTIENHLDYEVMAA